MEVAHEAGEVVGESVDIGRHGVESVAQVADLVGQSLELLVGDVLVAVVRRLVVLRNLPMRPVSLSLNVLVPGWVASLVRPCSFSPGIMLIALLLLFFFFLFRGRLVSSSCHPCCSNLVHV